MLLVRFVSDPSAWTKALIRRDQGVGQLPIVALRAFTPTAREINEISLYRLEDVGTAPTLAGAYWLLNKDAFAMLAVEEELIKEAGFKFRHAPGLTYHPAVNEWHTDLLVESGEDSIKAATIYYEQGRLLPVDGKEIRAGIANDNAAGAIEFVRLAIEKKDPQRNQLCELLSKETLLLTTPI